MVVILIFTSVDGNLKYLTLKESLGRKLLNSLGSAVEEK
jgi:hypothetical protein